jgi:hypothetical protein
MFYDSCLKVNPYKLAGKNIRTLILINHGSAIEARNHQAMQYFALPNQAAPSYVIQTLFEK